MASGPAAAYRGRMANYTLKLYRRPDPDSSPGQLIGRYAFSADGNPEAVDHATTSFVKAITDSDYAVIGGLNGRIVWEKGRRA